MRFSLPLRGLKCSYKNVNFVLWNHRQDHIDTSGENCDGETTTDDEGLSTADAVNLLDAMRREQNATAANERWNDSSQIQRAIMVIMVLLDASSGAWPFGMTMEVAKIIGNLSQWLYRSAGRNGAGAYGLVWCQNEIFHVMNVQKRKTWPDRRKNAMLSASKMLRHASNFQGGVQTIWIFGSCWHVGQAQGWHAQKRNVKMVSVWVAWHEKHVVPFILWGLHKTVCSSTGMQRSKM